MSTGGPPKEPPEMRFRLLSKCGRLRHGELTLPHSRVQTPVFMPLLDLDCQILLCNNYHLGHRPGHELVKKAGGIHEFMQWPRSMVSLSKLMKVTEEGVEFESPHTKELMMLTPERCIELQEAIGADIMMQLDHVVPSLTTGPLVEEAMQRSIRWLDRCIAAQTRTDQVLFPIIQGGLNLELRAECTKEMIKRVKVGIAIGGLSGGEEKDKFWRIVAKCCEQIPEGIPRYVMGVGHSVDMVVASVLGADMFDCVFPTRTARFGTAITRREGELHLSQRKFREDFRPIDEECTCHTCKSKYKRFLPLQHDRDGRCGNAGFCNILSLVGKAPDAVACHLISIHNIHHHFELMRRLRTACDKASFHDFLHEFVGEQFGSVEKTPRWVLDAFEYAGYRL
ncbi:Queuine tRNA-ribosyltransferase catalytic subunit 1 [Aphelenchoides fujianensis]|nr:Queuine tRNA-ribosyltransferase catalytic subunit 1 [Aphelenchoides fujianensis]